MTGARGLLFLLTNDDGYQAAGLAALREALARHGRVVTVAPAAEMSGVSHALTLSRPLSVELVDEDVHAVDGTPTDCVNLALNRLLRERPSACVSGVNHGQNLGDDVSYSGTVGAAYEATLFGIPSVAVSQVRGEPHSDFGHASRLGAEIARILASRERALPSGTFVNLNAPEGAPLGVSATRLARRVYVGGAAPHDDPLGRRYYWVGGRPAWHSVPGTDHHAVTTLGHASVSLVGTDLSLALPRDMPRPHADVCAWVPPLARGEALPAATAILDGNLAPLVDALARLLAQPAATARPDGRA
jgi:5'-nucleotidase